MKLSLTSAWLIQFAFITQYGLKFVVAAPTDVQSEFENEIPAGKDEEVKRFREAYALRMKSFMNASVDPCDDFHEYACGNFANTVEEMELSRKRSNLLDIFFTLVDLLDKSLERTRHPDEKYYEELQKAKQYMNSCVNAKLWPIQPSNEYLEVLRAIGGFPAIDPSWNASAFDWFNMTAHLTRYGIDGLIKEDIYLKHPFPPYYVLPKFGFDFDVYAENIATKESQGYVYNAKIMSDMLNVYGVTGPKADKVIEDIIEFWGKALLANKLVINGCPLEISLTDDVYSNEFSRWKTFFNIAWNTTQFNYTEISDCPCDYYYKYLDEIVAERSEAVANYMALKFLYTMHPQLQSTKHQRLNCLIRVKNALPLVMSHFYMKEHYNKAAEEEIYEIVGELKDSLQHLVETANWLDEPTRLEALEKVKTLRIRVGQVLDPISDTFIKETRKLTFTDNFAANNLELAKFEVDMHHYGYLHADIDENTSPKEMLDSVQVNAFYYVLDNSINIMAGVLHPPVFHPNLPKSVKYGSLGYILGHELTHGLDNMGSNFDANLTLRYWWSEKSGQTFEERSNCFAEHYGEFDVPELKQKINGTKSLDENIADSGGLREALNAYRKVFKAAVKNKVEDFERHESLPGLDLTAEQTFFLSFAQIYCSKYTAKHLWVELSDDHPLDKYRVLGSLQNFEEFPLVFNCPLGSPMNPNEKCRVW